MWTEFDHEMMQRALAQARIALEKGEIPVGAVVVRDGRIISEAHNTRETSLDPAGHAEINALRLAAQALGSWRLPGCTLYVTLEPCVMCAGAIVQARLDRVIFGAPDSQAGGCGGLYRITEDPAFNHFTPVSGGLLKEECASLIANALRG